MGVRTLFNHPARKGLDDVNVGMLEKNGMTTEIADAIVPMRISFADLLPLFMKYGTKMFALLEVLVTVRNLADLYQVAANNGPWVWEFLTDLGKLVSMPTGGTLPSDSAAVEVAPVTAHTAPHPHPAATHPPAHPPAAAHPHPRSHHKHKE